MGGVRQGEHTYSARLLTWQELSLSRAQRQIHIDGPVNQLRGSRMPPARRPTNHNSATKGKDHLAPSPKPPKSTLALTLPQPLSPRSRVQAHRAQQHAM